jgi:acetoacetate decarboxylase
MSQPNFWPAPVGEPFGVKELARRSLDLARHSALIFEKSLIITAEVAVDPKEAKALLPYGLWLPKRPTALLFAADHRKPAFTRHYQEVALMLRVESIVGKGLLVAWMLVNDDSALIYGREVLGYPKKMATITIEDNAGAVRVRAARREGEIFALDVKKGRRSPRHRLCSRPISSRSAASVSFSL